MSPLHGWLAVLGIYLAAVAVIVGVPNRLIKFAVFMGLFGAFPGFVLLMVPEAAKPIGHLWTLITLPVPYLAFGAPLIFGPYCFLAALAGGFLIRLSQESPKKWLEPAAIVALPLLAAVPWSLLGWAGAAFGASIFWIVVMLVFRRWIFKRDPSERMSAIYRWLTEFKRG